MGGGIMHWLAVVCLSVPCLTLSWECKLNNDRKEAHDTGDLSPHLQAEKSNTCRVAATLHVAQFVCFTATLMSNGQLMYYDQQAESSDWLFIKSPLVGGGGSPIPMYSLSTSAPPLLLGFRVFHTPYPGSTFKSFTGQSPLPVFSTTCERAMVIAR